MTFYRGLEQAEASVWEECSQHDCGSSTTPAACGNTKTTNISSLPKLNIRVNARANVRLKLEIPV